MQQSSHSQSLSVRHRERCSTVAKTTHFINPLFATLASWTVGRSGSFHGELCQIGTVHCRICGGARHCGSKSRRRSVSGRLTGCSAASGRPSHRPRERRQARTRAKAQQVANAAPVNAVDCEEAQLIVADYGFKDIEAELLGDTLGFSAAHDGKPFSIRILAADGEFAEVKDCSKGQPSRGIIVALDIAALRAETPGVAAPFISTMRVRPSCASPFVAWSITSVSGGDRRL